MSGFGALDTSRRIELVAELVRTLDFLHRRGLLHRDLKPDNLILAGAPDAPRIVLIDFGLATRAEDGSDIAGSLPYLAPELFEGRPHSLASDLYALGVMLYLRYIPKLAWFANWSLAVYIGYYIGVIFTQRLHGEILPQAKGTMLPLNVGWGPSICNLVVIVGVVTVLIYFFFSSPHKGALKPAARMGIYFLMISFGASFGYTVMGRISLLIGRLTFVINEWAQPVLRAAGGG